MRPLRVENLAREQTLVSAGQVAGNMWTRMRGLIGHKPLAEGEGLLIVPSNSIHTHFMGFPIDVLYLSRAGEVMAVDQKMVPWRFGRIHFGAHSVLELPAGTVARSGTQVGDQLQIQTG